MKTFYGCFADTIASDFQAFSNVMLKLGRWQSAGSLKNMGSWAEHKYTIYYTLCSSAHGLFLASGDSHPPALVYTVKTISRQKKIYNLQNLGRIYVIMLHINHYQIDFD